MKSNNERKQRKEAQKYFRQNNSQFLSDDEWIKTLVPSIIWSVIIGIVYGLLTKVIPFEFSIFYIIIGVMIANIVNAAAGKTCKQVGYISVGCTLFTYLITTFVQLMSFLTFFGALVNLIPAFFNQNILGWICMIGGCVAAYLQGSDNRFM